MELRDVREPLFVGSRRLEIAIDEILWCRADFSNIRTIPAALWPGRSVASLGFIRFRKKVVFQLQIANVTLERLDLQFQLVPIRF